MSATITTEVEGVLRRALQRNKSIQEPTLAEVDLLSVLQFAIDSIDRHHQWFKSEEKLND